MDGGWYFWGAQPEKQRVLICYLNVIVMTPIFHSFTTE